MSENVNDTEQAAETPQDGEQEQEPKTFDAEYVEKLRKESAKYRTEAKANADAAKRLAEIEQEQMSEAEKASARIKAAEDRAADLEAANDRKDVALEFGLSRDDASLLDDLSDPEAMRRLAERLAMQNDDSRTPRPDPNQGRAGGDSLSNEDRFAAFAKNL